MANSSWAGISGPSTELKGFNSHNIDWSRALGTCRHFIENHTRAQTAFQALKGFAHILFMHPSLPARINGEFLFFKSIARPDLDFLFRAAADACPYDKTVVDHHYQPALNLTGLTMLVRNLPALFALKAATRHNWPAALYLYVNYIRCVQVLAIAAGMPVQNLIVFGDMQQLDSCLVQHFRQRGARTATLQHGLYLDTSTDRRNINYVNYRNIVAEYFLAWGTATKTLVERHTSAKVEIVGKPILPLRPANPVGPDPFFAVLFDSTAFQQQNRELLSIALEIEQRTGARARFCPHPDNVLSDYNLDPGCILPREKIPDALFVIGHSTTYLIELLRLGMRVYRLHSKFPWHLANADLIFSSAGELAAKLDRPQDSAAIANPFIDCIGTDSLSRYEDFYRSLAAGPEALEGKARVRIARHSRLPVSGQIKESAAP